MIGKQVTLIDLQDWDELVSSTYGRVYKFQQQDGCKARGVVRLTVPEVDYVEDYENTSVPEVAGGPEMGVSFAAWLARDPKQILTEEGDYGDGWRLELWWERNFYPHVSMVVNDLYAKGLLPAGEYIIDIDW